MAEEADAIPVPLPVAVAVPVGSIEGLVVVPGKDLKANTVLQVRTPSGATGKVVVAQPAAAGVRLPIQAEIIYEAYKPELVINRGVYFGPRKPMDVTFAAVFAVLCIGSIINALATIFGAPTIQPQAEWQARSINGRDQHKCPEGYNKCAAGIPEEEYINTGVSCGGFGHPRKLGDKPDPPKSVWDVFEKAPVIPTVLIIIVFVIGVVWLLLLQKAAKQCVYATEHIKAACCFFGAYITREAHVAFPGIFTVLGVGILVFFYYNRPHFDFAAGVLSQASVALRKNPKIFVVSVGIYVCYLVYLMFFMGYLMNIGRWGHWETVKLDGYWSGKQDCHYVVDSSENSTRVMSLVFLWVTGVFQQIRLFVITGSVATWWFHSPNDSFAVELPEGHTQPANPAMYFLKHSVTTSLGSLSVGGLILAILDYIKREVFRKVLCCYCWMFNPLTLFLRILWCFFADCIRAFTRFTTAIHTIAAKPFFESARLTIALLKRNFVGAYIADSAAHSTLVLGAFIFSLAMTFISWSWIEDHFEIGFLHHAKDLPAQGWFGLLFFMFFFVYNPMFTIFVYGLFLGSYEMIPAVLPFFAALFIGAVCYLIFKYFAFIVLDTVTATFICFSIDREQGVVGSHPKLENMLNQSKSVKMMAYAEGSPQLAMLATIANPTSKLNPSEEDVNKFSVGDGSPKASKDVEKMDASKVVV